MICYTWLGMKTTTNDMMCILSLTLCVWFCVLSLIFWNQYPPTAAPHQFYSIKRAISGWKKCGKQRTENEFIDKLTLRAFAHKNFIAWTCSRVCCAVLDICGYKAVAMAFNSTFYISISLSTSSSVGYLSFPDCLTGYLSLRVYECLSLSPFFSFTFHFSFVWFACVWALICVLKNFPSRLHWLRKYDILFD